MLEMMNKGSPPLRSSECPYLLYNGDFHIGCYWTSKEIYSHGGERTKGHYIDREGFSIDDVTYYLKLEDKEK